jgi:hypothetical protein
MKTTQWMIMLLLSGALAMVGCGKPKQEVPTAQGVAVNIPKLREAFASASPECQSAVNEVAQGFRYGEYTTSMAALAKLDSAPGVTDAQKKIVAEVAEQIKQLAGKGAVPPAR